MRAQRSFGTIGAVIVMSGLGVLSSLGATAQDATGYLRSGDYANAAQTARAALEATSASPENFLALGDALAAMGNIDEAINAYAQLRRDDGNERADGQLAIARLEILYLNPAEGEARLERVLSGYRNARASLSAAELVAAGDAARDLAVRDPSLYTTALAAYEAAIAKAPQQPQPLVAMGKLLLHRYNNAEALDAFQSALQLDADYPPALLGLAHSQRFDHDPATRETVDRVLMKNANNVEALSLLTTLQIELEAYDRASESVARALAVNPKSPQALTQRAALSFLRGDEALFEQQVTELRRLVPGYSALYETLAEIAAQNRRYTRASQFALLAVTLNRNSWRGHALLGANRMRLGDMDNARRSLELAFRGDPFDPLTKNALDLLDRLQEYKRIPSARFELVADPKEAEILAQRILPIAEQAYTFFEQRYDYRPPTPIRIEFYPRHEDFSVRTVGLVGVDIVGVSFGPVVAMDSPSAGVFGPLNYGSVLWHELAHTFHLGLTHSKVPRWFSEGLAVFEERQAGIGWGGDVTPGFLKSYREGRLPKPSELNQVFLRPSGPDVLVHGYYLASLLMELIEREHGFNAILGMLNAYAQDSDTEQAIRTVLGREPEDLDIAFKEFMSTRFGAAADALVGDDAGGVDSYTTLLKRAADAMSANEVDSAFEALSKAQQMLPQLAGSLGTYTPLAEVHERRGEIEQAIVQLSRGIAIDADDLEAHKALARLYEARGETEAAAEVLDRTMLIQPFDPSLHRRLAALYEMLQQWPGAIRARRAVAALDDTDPVQARYLLARAHYRAGDLVIARSELLRALELAPLYEEALELLLSIRERAGALTNSPG